MLQPWNSESSHEQKVSSWLFSEVWNSSRTCCQTPLQSDRQTYSCPYQRSGGKLLHYCTGRSELNNYLINIGIMNINNALIGFKYGLPCIIFHRAAVDFAVLGFPLQPFRWLRSNNEAHQNINDHHFHFSKRWLAV